MIPVSNKYVKLLTVLFFLGLGIRLIYVSFSSYYLKYDDINYHQLAVEIAHGSEITFYFTSSGYSFLLGLLIFLFGDHFIVIQVVQSLLSSLTALMMYRIGKSLHSQQMGLIVFIIFMFNPTFVRYSQQLMSETLFIFLLVSLFYILEVYSRFTPTSLLVLGFLSAYAFVVRNMFLFFIPVIIFWMIWQQRNKISSIYSMGFMVVGLGSVLIPFFMINYSLLGTPFTSSGGGLNLWMGNNPDATGFYDMALYREKIGRDDHVSVETDAYLRNEVKQFISEHPWQFLLLFLKKTYLLWKPDTYLLTNGDLQQKIYGMGKVFYYLGVILIPGLVGIWLSRHYWRRYGLTFLFVLYNTAIVALHVVLFRYRIPMLPCMMIFSAVFYVSVGRYIHNRWFRA